MTEALGGDNLHLRRSALLDLAAIGYLPAAKAISETLAENSFKLIALKGLLEYHLTINSKVKIQESKVESQLLLSDEVIEVMSLMDSLL